ncbi:MAG: biopolymer transporter ExbD [Ferruginibacter sp.]
MAEIINNQKKITGSKRAIKRDTRVDLTPMVDLGFLLITFFIFTTSMMEPKVLEMVEPYKTDNDNLCESCVLTILLADSNNIFYYEGNEDARQIKKSNFSTQGIRKILMEKKKKVIALRGKNEFSLIIKPTEWSIFQNLITLQDEATLTGVIRYYMSEPTISDIAAIKNSRLSLLNDK